MKSNNRSSFRNKLEDRDEYNDDIKDDNTKQINKNRSSFELLESGIKIRLCFNYYSFHTNIEIFQNIFIIIRC